MPVYAARAVAVAGLLGRALAETIRSALLVRRAVVIGIARRGRLSPGRSSHQALEGVEATAEERAVAERVAVADVFEKLAALLSGTLGRVGRVWTWSVEPGTCLAASEHVTVCFEPRGPATEVVAIYEHIDDERRRNEHQAGWCGYLDGLEGYLAS